MSVTQHPAAPVVGTTVSALKTADATRTNTSAMTSDAELSVALTPGTWALDLMVAYTADQTGDIAVSWSLTGATAIRRAFLGPDVVTSTMVSTTIKMGSTTLTGPTNPISYGGHLDGAVTQEWLVVSVATAATIAVMFGQRVASATATTIQAGSHVVARKLA